MTGTSIKTGSIDCFIVLAVVVVIGMSLYPPGAFAQADNWTRKGGKWSTARNWSTKKPPTDKQNVTIGTAKLFQIGDFPVVTLDTNGVAANLTVTAPSGKSHYVLSSTKGKTLKVGGDVNIAGELTLANESTLDVGGNYTLSGITGVDAGSGNTGLSHLCVAKKMSINKAARLNIGNDKIPSPTYVTVGTTDTPGELDNSGTIILQGNKPPKGKLFAGGGGVLTVNGDATNSNKVGIFQQSKVKVSGTYTQKSGTTLVGGSSAKGGERAVLEAGKIDLEEGGGTIAVNNGGSLTATGDFDSLATLTVDVPGNLSKTGFGGSTVSVGGKFTNSFGGTVTLGTSRNTGPSLMSAKELDNFGNLTITGGKGKGKEASLTVNGTATNDVAGSIDIQNNAMLNVVGTYTQTDGKTAIQAGGQMNVQDDYTQTDGATTVQGTLNAAGHDVDIAGGAVAGYKTKKNPKGGTIKGNVKNAAKVIPGYVDPGPGTLMIDGNYTQTASGALVEMFNGTGAGDFGVLDVTGAASLNGSLEVNTISPFVQGFTPSDVGDTFRFMTYSSLTGGFTSLDYNGDILSAIGTSPLGLPDSFALDGIILNLLYTPDAAYLEIAASPAPAPEPASLLLFGGGLLGLAFGWRRWQRRRKPARELTASRA